MTPKSHKPGDRIALMAGTFDPFTVGHASIVERGLALFDRVIICVGINAAKAAADPTLVTHANDRAKTIADIYADEPRVDVIASGGLTADVANAHGARFLLRGIRSVRDFEYERDMADLNKKIGGLETVMLTADPEFACVSSSAVRDIASHGGDVSSFIPTTDNA